MRGTAYIGTSGWTYEHWKHSFYEGAPVRRWLEIITEKFNTVEVNGTFYRQQKRETFEAWARRVPDDFRFSIRGHRYVTHRKSLIDVEESVKLVKEQASGLGDKLACVLWQLPPQTQKDLDRLRSFAEILNGWQGPRHAMEFRHRSWFDDEVETLLRDYGLVNTISDAGRFKRWDAVTASTVYVRLHGKPRTYFDSYSDEQLLEWSSKVKAWVKEGRDVFVYFDNDALGAAPWNALKLRDLVRKGSRRAYAS